MRNVLMLTSSKLLALSIHWGSIRALTRGQENKPRKEQKLVEKLVEKLVKGWDQGLLYRQYHTVGLADDPNSDDSSTLMVMVL